MNRTGRSYATGALASQIRTSSGYWRSPTEGRELEGKVTSHAKHSYYVHEGTLPHLIFPRTPGGHLRFFWHKRGKVVAPPFVKHPGTMANRWMERALEMSIV